MKVTNNRLQTLQDKDMNLLLESIVRGGISSVLGDRFVKSEKHQKVFYRDADKLYGGGMIQSPACNESKIN